MNLFSILGLLLAVGVLGAGLRMASPDLKMFWDSPSAFIVLGGTLAATSICYQINQIFTLFKIFVRHITGGKKINYANIIAQMIVVGEAYRKGEAMEQHIGKVQDYFLKEAMELINDGVLEEDDLIRVLSDRSSNMHYLRTEDTNKIKVMGQFPPAFGMMGTTIGMIVLLANLGGEDAMKMIGPAMGVCLITTLYGVIVANLAIIPIAENLQQNNKDVHLKNQIVIAGVQSIIKKINPVVMAEELNSFLPPGQRLDWKQVLGK